MRNVKGLLLAMVLCLSATVVWAGDISGGGDPTTAGGGAMNTLEDIYNLVNRGTTNVPRTDAFHEPSAAPGSTGPTLTEVYERAKTSARPAKTGQTPTVPYAAPEGSDGNLQKGVAWPSLRFTDNNGNGTVTDNLTGLIWLKAANYNSTTGTTGWETWANALAFCNTLNDGECGLSDGSKEGDWRLPNVMELLSLIDWRYYYPALCNAVGTGQWSSGNAFTGVQDYYYWSSSPGAGGPGDAWVVFLRSGYLTNDNKTYTNCVWPVRGGQ